MEFYCFQTLKTEEELEAEDRAAQEAVMIVSEETRILTWFQKLQELLRRGTPAALEEANELMKILAGYVKT